MGLGAVNAAPCVHGRRSARGAVAPGGLAFPPRGVSAGACSVSRPAVGVWQRGLPVCVGPELGGVRVA